MERLRDLNVQWDGLRSRLQFILQNDVARFNELMRSLGLPAVRVEGGRIIT